MRGIRLKLITTLTVAVLVPLLLGLASLRYFGARYFVAQQGDLLMNAAAYTASSLEEGIIAQADALSNWISLSRLGHDLAAFDREHRAPPDDDRIRTLESEWAGAADTAPLVAAMLHNPVSDRLRSFRKLNPLLVEILVTDQFGSIRAGTNKSSDYWQADETWWRKAAALDPIESLRYE